jgi:integrase
MAYISRDDSGRFYIRERGKPRSKPFTTREEAEAALEEANDGTLLSTYLRNWSERRVAQLEKRGQIPYASSIEIHVRVHLLARLPAKLKLAELKKFHVNELFNEMLDSGVSAKTVKNVRATFSLAIEDAFQQEKIASNVVKLSKIPVAGVSSNDKRKSLTIDQAAKLSEILENLDGYRWRTPFLWCLHGGLRRSEVLALKVEDVKLQKDGSIFVWLAWQMRREKGVLVRRPPKTEGGKRYLKFSPQLVEVLKLDLDRPSGDWLFPGVGKNPLSIDGATKSFKKFAEKNGLPKGTTLHSLRHTFASITLNTGIPLENLSSQLGHSDVQSTMGYVHRLGGEALDASAASDAIFRNKKNHDEEDLP